ncbi:MAG TPA: helix-turn-helix transcriptional regulator, partial [Propionibacteriaceae bacterium]|nr:helix-turn-helix transcriptional regulator [Propionibacteriaceae bacterium]
MPGPLLETKLHTPRRRQGLVARPRLIDHLSRGGESALTLVSAPAGFGKTTLLADWLGAVVADGRGAAWLSLDQRDNDPALFWTYLIEALKTAVPGLGGSALSLLESPQPPMEVVLATLLNDLSAISNDVVIVLDDYHVIDARDVLDGM